MNKHLTYEEWFNSFLDYEDAYKMYFELQKEVDRLSENNLAMQEEMARTWEKLDKANNIINELEKWLKSKIDYFDKTAKDTILHEQMVIRVIYDYLQELKGDSSNE